MRKKIMPTTYLLVAILLCVVVNFLVPIFYLIPSSWNLIGIIPLFFGLWINLSADRAFKKAETTVKPFEESNTLIQDGVFRWSRNPMYLGFIAILLGISVLLRSRSPLAGADAAIAAMKPRAGRKLRWELLRISGTGYHGFSSTVRLHSKITNLVSSRKCQWSCFQT
jgi:protein-S-isoprenylcysteine O-methyltransferase Ste14